MSISRLSRSINHKKSFVQLKPFVQNQHQYQQKRKSSNDIYKSMNIFPIKIQQQQQQQQQQIITSQNTNNNQNIGINNNLSQTNLITTLKNLNLYSPSVNTMKNVNNININNKEKQNNNLMTKKRLSIKNRTNLKIQTNNFINANIQMFNQQNTQQGHNILKNNNDMSLSSQIDDQKMAGLSSQHTINQLKRCQTAKKNKRSSIVYLLPNQLIEQDSQKIFQKLHKNKQLLIYDHNRMIMQTSKFKYLLNDFQYQLREIKTDRDTLQQKITRFQHYFKQMRFKHIKESIINQQDCDKNQQLKILNLEKKVETLNYIIKQYRSNNQQQIKLFQQKINNYKPNIQRQLTQKLIQTNQKYQNLFKKVQYYQKKIINVNDVNNISNVINTNGQKSKQSKQIKGNLQKLIENLMMQEEKNIKNIQKIQELNKEIIQMKVKQIQYMKYSQKIKQLQQSILSLTTKNQHLTDIKLSLQQVIQQRDKKIDQLNHFNQQLSFKLQGYKNLQNRMQNKQKTIKKNTIIINKLQFQNIQLKTKIDTVFNDFKNIVFQQTSLQQIIDNANQNITDLTQRIHQIFMDMCQNNSNLKKSMKQDQNIKQKQYFIGHLFQKIKASYNEIVLQYQNQLKLTADQCKKWKDTFNIISKNQQNKFNYIKKAQLELYKIQQKKAKCQQSFIKMTGVETDFKQNDCIKCTYLAAYWGQLENSYSQIKILLEKIMKLQSQKPLPAQGTEQIPQIKE